MATAALLISAIVLPRAAVGSMYRVMHEFSAVDYVWPSLEDRTMAIESGEFIQANNLITGLKACNSDVAPRCGPHERLFATVPRWLPGVPATLSEVVKDASGASLLKPWPSMEAQDPHDCEKIQYVQSMEIDPDGVMWIIDVGRKYFNDPASDNTCPPKMVLLDIPSEKIIDTYIFPSDVAPYTGSFLNDIVLDVPNQVAYISSTGNNVTDLGAVVVYDRNGKRSRRFEHPSTHAEAAVFDIHGFENQGVPTDGIALHPNRDRVFYSALSGLHLYSISAGAFKDFSLPMSAVSDSLVDHGPKPDISDGMAFGADGSLFFGGLQSDSVYRWHPESGKDVIDAEVLATNHEDLFWVDTLAFDNRGHLLVTSNKLILGLTHLMDFDETNFRIISLPVGTSSYMKAEHTNNNVVT